MLSPSIPATAFAGAPVAALPEIVELMSVMWYAPPRKPQPMYTPAPSTPSPVPVPLGAAIVLPAATRLAALDVTPSGLMHSPPPNVAETAALAAVRPRRSGPAGCC